MVKASARSKQMVGFFNQVTKTFVLTTNIDVLEWHKTSQLESVEGAKE